MWKSTTHCAPVQTVTHFTERAPVSGYKAHFCNVKTHDLMAQRLTALGQEDAATHRERGQLPSFT